MPTASGGTRAVPLMRAGGVAVSGLHGGSVEIQLRPIKRSTTCAVLRRRYKRSMPDFTFECAEEGVVCGVDEVGRGPWAGPVLAAAVILDRARLPASLATQIDDSKKLTRRKRERLFVELPEYAVIGIGHADIAEIEALNILWAAMLAMQRAVAALRGVRPDVALVDGNRAPKLPCAARPVVGGDALCLSIAAASIVAKVTRDRMMTELAEEVPGYGFERNAGYGTAEHRQALLRLGPSSAHRRGFPSVRGILEQRMLAFSERT